MRWVISKDPYVLRPLSWVSASALLFRGIKRVGTGNGTLFLSRATQALYFLPRFQDGLPLLINTCGLCHWGQAAHQSSGLNFLICKTRDLGLTTPDAPFPVAKSCEAIQWPCVLVRMWFGYVSVMVKSFSLLGMPSSLFGHRHCSIQNSF